MACEPPGSSTKDFSWEFDKVITLIWLDFWEEYFCLSVVWGCLPLLIPGLLALKSTSGFDMGERDWSGEQVRVMWGLSGRDGD